jgi:hypothetical protein
MRLTVKFAHFNQRYARLSQYKASSEKAYQSIESQVGLLFSKEVSHAVSESGLALSSLGRK